MSDSLTHGDDPDHRPRRRRDRGVPRPARRRRAARRRGRHPPHAGLRPGDQGDRAALRRARLRRDLSEPVLARGARRGARRRGGARARANGGVPDERLVGDVGGAAAYLRVAADVQRQGRRDRLLLGRAAGRARRVQPRPRRRRRLLRRVRHRHAAGGLPAQGAPTSSTSCRTCAARCSGLFGNEDQLPEPRAGRRARRDPHASTASPTSSTATTTPGTRSSPSTGRPTGSRPPTTAGSGSRRSTPTYLGG